MPTACWDWTGNDTIYGGAGNHTLRRGQWRPPFPPGHHRPRRGRGPHRGLQQRRGRQDPRRGGQLRAGRGGSSDARRQCAADHRCQDVRPHQRVGAAAVRCRRKRRSPHGRLAGDIRYQASHSGAGGRCPGELTRRSGRQSAGARRGRTRSARARRAQNQAARRPDDQQDAACLSDCPALPARSGVARVAGCEQRHHRVRVETVVPRARAGADSALRRIEVGVLMHPMHLERGSRGSGMASTGQLLGRDRVAGDQSRVVAAMTAALRDAPPTRRRARDPGRGDAGRSTDNDSLSHPPAPSRCCTRCRRQRWRASGKPGGARDRPGRPGNERHRARKLVLALSGPVGDIAGRSEVVSSAGDGRSTALGSAWNTQ